MPAGPPIRDDRGDKDVPLRDDIRLLGRVLGDTVRAQEGEAVFELVERIRQTAIRFHRDEDEAARPELDAILTSLSRPPAIQIIRAFSYFSHLANIAEDQHHIRRTRRPCGRRVGAARWHNCRGAARRFARPASRAAICRPSSPRHSSARC